MKKQYWVLFSLHIFVGIGAMAGGLGAILNPHSPMDVPVEILKNSPFDSFLIPGILLFGVIGIGNVIAALALFFKWKMHAYISNIFSWAQVVWIIVQCIMLQAIAALHVIFFSLGAISGGLAMLLLFEQGLFPANIIMGCYKKISQQA